MEKIRIFLSYSNKDYELAKSIKEGLGNVGFNVFLAHTSIEPSLAWENEILIKLKTCNVFIPILTKNFRESKWTDQEVGIAYALEKKFISLIVDEISPYGFMGKWQGLRFKTEEKWLKSEINRLILKITSIFPKEVRKTVLDSIKKINSFNKANLSFALINKFHPLTDKEINKIIRDSLNNPDIKNGFNSREFLKNG